LIYKVKFTSAYKRSYKRLKKRGLDISLLDAVVEELCQGRLLHKNIKITYSKETLQAFTNVMLNPIGCLYICLKMTL